MSCLFFFLFLFLFLCYSCPCFFVLLGRSLESSGSYEAVHLTFMFTRHGMILTCHVSTPTSSWPVSFDATKCLLADSHPVISFFPACIPPVRAWTRTSNNTVQANLTRKITACTHALTLMGAHKPGLGPSTPVSMFPREQDTSRFPVWYHSIG